MSSRYEDTNEEKLNSVDVITAGEQTTQQEQDVTAQGNDDNDAVEVKESDAGASSALTATDAHSEQSATDLNSTMISGIVESNARKESNALDAGSAESKATDADKIDAHAGGNSNAAVDSARSRPITPLKDDNVTILIRPQDEGWVMGEDWPIRFPYQHTLNQLKIYVEEHRGISRHRIQLRLREKILMPNRENWTVRRYGIYDGYIVCVEPTLSGSWLWNPIEYYENKLIDEIIAQIDSQPENRIRLSDLEPLVHVPPCISKKSNLRAFLRKYPEKFYIHTEDTDFIHWVHRTTHPYQLPTYGDMSIRIGNFKHYEPKPFDWEAYRDVDDMYQIDDFEALERKQKEIEMLMNGGVDPSKETAAVEESKQKPVDAAAEQEAAELAVALDSDSIEHKDGEEALNDGKDEQAELLDNFKSVTVDEEGEKMIAEMNALFGQESTKDGAESSSKPQGGIADGSKTANEEAR